MPRALRPLLWILLVGFCLSGVFDHSLWGPNDAGEAGMIAEMRRDHVYAATVINHELILEKPPLAQWAALAFCAVAGRINEGLVRLPSALCGLGTLVLLYVMLRGRRGTAAGGAPDDRAEIAAWSAVFLCAGAAEFWQYSRVVLTDMTLVFTVMLSIFLFQRAWERGERDASATGWRWAPFLVAAALAFYAKGLIGPALIWCAVGSFLLWRRRVRLLFGLGAVYAAVLVLAVAPWAAAIARLGGREALLVVFRDNQLGRFLTFTDRSLPHDPFFVHKEPIYHYVLALPYVLMPWTPLVIPALVAWWKPGTTFRRPLHVFLRAVTVGMLVLLHVSSAKSGRYALPLFPFFFAMTGVWLTDAAARPRFTRLEAWCGGLTVAIVSVALLGAPLGLVALWFRRPDLAGPASGATGFRIIAGAALAFVIAATGLVAMLRARRGALRAWALPLAPGLALWALGALWIPLLPVLEMQRSYTPLIDLTRREMADGRMPALYRGDLEWVGALVFYLDRTIPIVESNQLGPYLASSEPRAVIVPDTDDRIKVEALPPGEPAAILTPVVSTIKATETAIYLNAAATARRGGGQAIVSGAMR
jgi:4-amino-4-deoxy-L-arabinose transferase-like glycosyltransferase